MQATGVKHLVALGGDHSITLPLLRALSRKSGPPALIHLDAHVDTWPENFGQKYAHGSVFYHAIEEGLVQPGRMVQVGIRSPVERGVHDWTLARGVVMITAQDVHEQGPPAIAEQVRQVIGNGPVYLSFDIDVLDPAFAPGVSHREPGGMSVREVLEHLHSITATIVGADIVEYNPSRDVSELTGTVAGKILKELLGKMLMACNCP